jgi:hypothetical protein
VGDASKRQKVAPEQNPKVVVVENAPVVAPEQATSSANSTHLANRDIDLTTALQNAIAAKLGGNVPDGSVPVEAKLAHLEALRIATLSQNSAAAMEIESNPSSVPNIAVSSPVGADLVATNMPTLAAVPGSVAGNSQPMYDDPFMDVTGGFDAFADADEHISTNPFAQLLPMSFTLEPTSALMPSAHIEEVDVPPVETLHPEESDTSMGSVKVVTASSALPRSNTAAEFSTSAATEVSLPASYSVTLESATEKPTISIVTNAHPPPPQTTSSFTTAPEAPMSAERGSEPEKGDSAGNKFPQNDEQPLFLPSPELPFDADDFAPPRLAAKPTTFTRAESKSKSVNAPTPKSSKNTLISKHSAAVAPTSDSSLDRVAGPSAARPYVLLRILSESEKARYRVDKGSALEILDESDDGMHFNLCYVRYDRVLNDCCVQFIDRPAVAEGDESASFLVLALISRCDGITHVFFVLTFMFTSVNVVLLIGRQQFATLCYDNAMSMLQKRTCWWRGCTHVYNCAERLKSHVATHVDAERHAHWANVSVHAIVASRRLTNVPSAHLQLPMGVVYTKIQRAASIDSASAKPRHKDAVLRCARSVAYTTSIISCHIADTFQTVTNISRPSSSF